MRKGAVVALLLVWVICWSAPLGAKEDPSPKDVPGDVSPLYRSLYPFGVREDGRPDRSQRAEQARAEAVTEALEWLVAHQDPKGHWPVANLSWCHGQEGRTDLTGAGKALYDVGVTGIAACAFLASGHNHLDGSPYAETIGRALSSLVRVQDAEGCFGPRTSQHFIYNHAFGTLAVVEAFGVTGDARLLGPARKALAFSVLARNPGRAWRYGVKPGDNDTSATGCMTLPFYAAQRINQSAEFAGLVAPLPFPSDVWAGIRAWVDQMTEESTGRTGYIQRGGATARPQEMLETFPFEKSEACAAVGLLLMQITPTDDPEGNAKLVEKGAKLLSAVEPRWDVGGGYTDLYYWYYGTLALHVLGGNAWLSWHHALREALLSSQRRDTDACAYRGSWDPTTPWGPDGGRIYVTAMAVLMLQSAHRFPPLPDGRADLVRALAAEDRPPVERVRLLDGVSAYGPEGARQAVAKLMSSPAPEVRAAAALALPACDPDGKGLRTLAGLLEDESIDVRRAAARALGRLECKASGAIPALVDALADPDVLLRVYALQALGTGSKDASTAVERVAALLEDKELRGRVAAASALARLAPDTARVESVLLEGLAAKDEVVRAEATEGLAAFPTPGAGAQAALEKALGDPSTRVRVEAARGLVHQEYDKSKLLDVLAACLPTKDPETRVRALRLVASMGRDAAETVPQVIDAAVGGSTRVRVAALEALLALGADAPGALAVLFAAEGARNTRVRQVATKALGTVSLSAKRRVAALAGALRSKNAVVIDGAVQGLIRHGEAAVPALSALLDGSHIETWPAVLRALEGLGPQASSAGNAVLDAIKRCFHPSVRLAAARAIGAIGIDSERAAKTLEEMSDSTSQVLWMEAVHALAKIGGEQPEAVRALSRMAEKEDKQNHARRMEALRALGTLGEAAVPALPAFVVAMSDEKDYFLREAAIQGVAGIGKPALEMLERALWEPDGRYRKSALDALGRMGEGAKKVIPRIEKALKAQNSDKAYDFARCLATIGKPALRSLTRLLKDKNSVTRMAAAWGLGLMGPVAKPAIGKLKRALKDESPGVRTQAKEAIQKIRPKR